MADFFTAGWSLDPSRSADSTWQERRQAVEHALAKLGPSDDLWVLGNAFKTTTSAEDAGNILSCTAARCHLLTGDSDPLRRRGTLDRYPYWASNLSRKGDAQLTFVRP
jgi:calcineurin-like phosphoesterase family protein